MRMYSLGNILPHVAPTLFAWPDPPGYISLKRRRLAAFVSPSGIIPDLWVHWDGATSLMAGGGYGTSSWGIFQIIPDLVRTKETHMTKHQRFSNCLICFQDLTWLKHADAEGPRNDLGHTCHCKIKPWIWPFWICGSFKTWRFLFLEKYEKCCSLLFVRKKQQANQTTFATLPHIENQRRNTTASSITSPKLWPSFTSPIIRELSGSMVVILPPFILLLSFRPLISWGNYRTKCWISKCHV